MAAFLVTFGPPGFYRPGQATVQTAALARTIPFPTFVPVQSSTSSFQSNLLGNVRDLKNRGGHPGHDQGRRLSIPQVVAPLYLEMRS